MSRKTIVPNIAYDTQRRTYYVTMRTRPRGGGPSRRTVRCYPTLKQAMQALDSFYAGRLLSQRNSAAALTVGQWLAYWLDQVVRPQPLRQHPPRLHHDCAQPSDPGAGLRPPG